MMAILLFSEFMASEKKNCYGIKIQYRKNFLPEQQQQQQ